MRKIIYLGLGAALIAADQASKYFAYHGNFGGFLNYAKPFLGKGISPNYHFAFGIAVPAAWAYSVYALIAVAAIWWFIKLKKRSRVLEVAFVLVAAGAISNLLDRFLLGYVRDFIYIFWGNILNFADIYITAGIILILFFA